MSPTVYVSCCTIATSRPDAPSSASSTPTTLPRSDIGTTNRRSSLPPNHSESTASALGLDDHRRPRGRPGERRRVGHRPVPGARRVPHLEAGARPSLGDAVAEDRDGARAAPRPELAQHLLQHFGLGAAGVERAQRGEVEREHRRRRRRGWRGQAPQALRQRRDGEQRLEIRRHHDARGRPQPGSPGRGSGPPSRPSWRATAPRHLRASARVRRISLRASPWCLRVLDPIGIIRVARKDCQGNAALPASPRLC